MKWAWAFFITILAANVAHEIGQEYTVYDKNYKRESTIRETAPDTYTIYDNQSRRTGTIRVNPDGSIDSFGVDGKRIRPTIRPSNPHDPTRERRSR